MKKTLKEQAERTTLDQKENQRISDVLLSEGPKNWEKLKQEIDQTAAEIGSGLRYSPRQNSFTLSAVLLKMEVQPDGAAIRFQGDRRGTFYPVVVGQSLRYSEKEVSPSTKLEEDLTIEHVAEKLIEIVVGPAH
jgi:hypothetical protein